MRYVFSAADTVRYRFPTHTGQIFFLQQGYGTLEVGTGDVVRIPAHTPHRIYCGSDTPLIYLSVDCLVGGRPAAEPTWDSHVRAMCAANGWDYDLGCHPKRER